MSWFELSKVVDVEFVDLEVGLDDIEPAPKNFSRKSPSQAVLGDELVYMLLISELTAKVNSDEDRKRR